jgi:hypothetical protein
MKRKIGLPIVATRPSISMEVVIGIGFEDATTMDNPFNSLHLWLGL